MNDFVRMVGVNQDEFSSLGYEIENEWFGSVDAEMLFTMVRHFHPTRVVEVGSGMSSSLILAALRVNRSEGWNGSLTSIDPDPRVELDPVIDHRRIQLQAAPRELFDLVEGDVLFIDSSHIMTPGSDVDVLYHQILPGLRSGVVVHVHDVFLPDPYPWTDRGYNEQEVLRHLLSAGGWTELWSSHTAGIKELAAFPSWSTRANPGSFWMEKL